MTDDEREALAHKIVGVAMEAIKDLGCDAAIFLVDPGGRKYVSARGGGSRITIARLAMEGTITLLKDMAEESGADLSDPPDKVKQALERLGMGGIFGAGSDHEGNGIGHLKDFTRKSKL